MTNQHDIIITKMGLEHLDDLVELENLSFSIPWTKNMFIEEIARGNGVYYVAINDAKVVGYIGMWIVFNEGNITNIAVHPNARRRGVAVKLLTSLLEFSKENNISDITLEVRVGNIPAINLYKRFDFIEEGTRKKYYSDNDEDATIMWKRFKCDANNIVS